MANQNLNLTTAGISAVMRSSRTFPAGFPIEDFADGEAITSGNVPIGDVVIGVDGRGAAWTILSPKPVTLTLFGASPAAKNLLLLAQAMEEGALSGAENEELELVITLPAQKMVVTYSAGIMTEYPSIPAIKNRVDNMQFSFKFVKASSVSI